LVTIEIQRTFYNQNLPDRIQNISKGTMYLTGGSKSRKDLLLETPAEATLDKLWTGFLKAFLDNTQFNSAAAFHDI